MQVFQLLKSFVYYVDTFVNTAQIVTATQNTSKIFIVNSLPDTSHGENLPWFLGKRYKILCVKFNA